MKVEKLENGKDTKHNHQLQKAPGEAMRLIRKMLLSPLNHASLGVRVMFLCVLLNGPGSTYKALFVLHGILFLSCQLQSAGISTVFQAAN